MTTLDTLSPVAPRTVQAPRVDLYATIHKALRLFMHDTLTRLGRLDATDAVDMDQVLGQLRELLDACRHHLAKENAYVHAAIEARRPGTSAAIADDHVEHLEAIAALEAEAAALRALPTAPAALRLYRHLARFVGDNLAHMHVEETQLNAALWAAYSDDELMQVHGRIVASIPPAEMAALLRWMIAAITPAERAEMLIGMRTGMPSDAFAGVLTIARDTLDDTAWAKLARALGEPPVPGLVTV